MARELLVRFGLVILVVLAGELLVYSIEHAHAATIGYRIEVRVCGDRGCAHLRTPANLWGGKYARDGRAETIRDTVADYLAEQRLKGRRPRIGVAAKCVPVYGEKEA